MGSPEVLSEAATRRWRLRGSPEEVLSGQLCCNRERVPVTREARQREPRGSSLARSFGAARRAADSHSALQAEAKLTAHFPARAANTQSDACPRGTDLTGRRLLHERAGSAPPLDQVLHERPKSHRYDVQYT